MGLRLSTRSEVFTPAENQSWLGSQHGTSEAESITLDADACLAVFTDGFVPSGVALFQDATSKRYKPATTADAANSKVLLFTSALIAGAGKHTAAAGLWHGRVLVANAPAARGTYVGLTSAVKTALSQIRFVG